ncbi:unnamed protein product [Brassica oleracea]
MHNVYSGAKNALQMSEKNVKGIRKNGSIGDGLLVVRLISSNHRNKLRSSFWDTLRSYGAEPPEDWSSTPPPPPPPLNAFPPNNIAPASNGAVKMDTSPLPDAAKNGYFVLTSLVRSMDQ